MNAKNILKMLCAVFVAAQCSFGIDGSFRYQTTKGMLDDNLDKSTGSTDFLGLGYYTDLSLVEGVNLYTNLTNIQQPGSGNNRYLLGLSGKLLGAIENLKSALFVELTTSTTQANITVLGQTGLGYVSVEKLDYDQNLGANVRQVQSATNEKINRTYSLLLNNTMTMGSGLTGGLMFSGLLSNSTLSTASATLTNPLSGVANYTSGAASFERTFNGVSSRSEKGTFKSSRDTMTIGADLGCALNLGDDLAINPFVGAADRINIITTTDDYSFTLRGTDVDTTIVQSYSEKRDNSGLRFKAGARGDIKWNSMTTTNASLTLGFDALTVKEEYSTTSNAQAVDTSLPGVNTQTVVINNTTTNKGSGTDLSLGLAVGTNVAVVENLDFGIGFGVAMDMLSKTYDQTVALRKDSTANDGDLQANDPNDFTRTTIATQGSVTKDQKKSTLGFVLPVGLEYRFGKDNMWAMRAGAQYSVYSTSNIEGQKNNTYETGSTTTAYNDGARDTTSTGTGNSTVYNYVLGKTEGSNEILSLTKYCFGLGFNPNKNFQMDILVTLSPAAASRLALSINNSFDISFTIKF